MVNAVWNQSFAQLQRICDTLAANSLEWGQPALLETIEHQVHKLLFCTGDEELLENQRWALTNADKMQQMTEKAHLHIQEFSEDKMHKEALGILKQLS